MISDSQAKVHARGLALLPLIVFLAIFLGSGIYHSLIGTEFAFYQVKAPVAAIPAIILALLLYRGQLNRAIEEFLQGASHPNLILIFMVFMLAGALPVPVVPFAVSMPRYSWACRSSRLTSYCRRVV